MPRSSSSLFGHAEHRGQFQPSPAAFGERRAEMRDCGEHGAQTRGQGRRRLLRRAWPASPCIARADHRRFRAIGLVRGHTTRSVLWPSQRIGTVETNQPAPPPRFTSLQNRFRSASKLGQCELWHAPDVRARDGRPPRRYGYREVWDDDGSTQVKFMAYWGDANNRPRGRSWRCCASTTPISRPNRL